MTVRLIDVAADRHVWGDSFDSLAREPFVMQDRVAEGVLCGVVPALTQAEVERLNDRPSDTLTARQMTLRAMPLAFAQDCVSLRRLLQVTEEALGKDPGDALSVAMAGLTHAYIANYLGTTAPAASGNRTATIGPCRYPRCHGPLGGVGARGGGVGVVP